LTVDRIYDFETVDSHAQDVWGVPAWKLSNINNATISNSTFLNNTAIAVLVVSCGQFSTRNSVFSKNIATYGSAIYMHKIKSAIIAESTFEFNKAYSAGSVYWLYGNMTAPIIRDNTWIGNEARYYGKDYASSFCGTECFVLHPKSLVFSDYGSINLPNLTIKTVDYYNFTIESYVDPVKINIDTARCLGRLKIDGNIANITKDPFIVERKTNTKDLFTAKLVNGALLLSSIGVRCIPTGKIIMKIGVSLSVPYDVLLTGTTRTYTKLYRHLVPIEFRNCIRGKVF
jgi:hypothetical protein